MWEEELREYKIYVSHIDDQEEYDIFLDKLDAGYNFEWKNYSEPGKKNFDEQMTDVDIVIILSGHYAKDELSIKKQIKSAQKLQKPIIAVRPYGMENVPPYIEELAQDIVGWNTPCIVEVIKENAIDENSK
ncbi:MAG: TIR domain-containing protein [Methanobacteriaceae archaeon]|nr:TIR domain-containing protein [Methanobacteriaceae archaeon]